MALLLMVLSARAWAPNWLPFPLEWAQKTVSRPLPEFPPRPPQHWLLTAPLKKEDLRGKVVFLDVWTFGWINCVRSLPWVREVEKKYGPRGLRVVGIHTPEFEFEKSPESVRKKLKEFQITYANMMDNDFAYWRLLGNRYWPTVYLVDRRGNIRYVHIGETHSGTRHAQEVEAFIEKLLQES